MSFSINTVTVDGNLTRDPELRTTPGGTSVCKLRIAHNARTKRGGEWEDVAYFFDITVWSGVGEWVANNCSKGTKIVVQGRLQWREWETDGNKRQAVDITADNIVVMRESSGGGGQRFNPESDVPPDTADFAPAAPRPGVSDDDIPF